MRENADQKNSKYGQFYVVTCAAIKNRKLSLTEPNCQCLSVIGPVKMVEMNKGGPLPSTFIA